MDISAITLENFKGVSKKTCVNLKPITLLFGPNSAGKSTLLQSLVYAREILIHNNIDPDRTALGGEVMDLGGFEQIVHAHDKSKIIKLGLEIDISDTDLPGVSGGNIDEGQFEEVLEKEDSKIPHPDIFLSNIERVECILSIAWSKVLNTPIVKEIDYIVNGELLFKIESSEDKSNTFISYFQLLHEILQLDGEEAWFMEFIQDVFDIDHVPDYDYSIANTFIPISGCDGALPVNGKTISINSVNNVSSYRSEMPFETELFISLFFNRLIAGPLTLLRERLDKLVYIGPLREVPPRNSIYRRTPDASRWSRGMAGWDILHHANDGFIKNVNEWLSSEKRLNSGYIVEQHHYKEISVDAVDKEIDESKLPIKSRIMLREKKNGIEVYPQDIGVGISQVIPVIIAALSLRTSIVAIEQPELHIHPALQVALGDLFASTVHENESMFLLETHSEHLMLRFLRRIREKYEGELPNDAPDISPDDISVIYVQNTDDGISFTQLNIGKDGEFTDRWPKGFFGERAEELF